MEDRSARLSEWDAIFPELNEQFKEAYSNLKEFSQTFTVLPKLCQILQMFTMIRPSEVRVVFIGQSPYPGICPITGIPYACGPAFLPNIGCQTTPITLQHIGRELCRDMQVARLPMPLPSMLLHWIGQGVMLLNACFTIGVGPACPRYLQDHSVLWEEIMHKIVHRLSNDLSNDPVFVLIGQNAWKFEKDISSNCTVLKTSHPAARGATSVPFVGSGVFSAVSSALDSQREAPISWLGDVFMCTSN